MFNPLTPAELTVAMGRTALEAAGADPTDTMLRAQLKSVYSASRHLAVELEAFEPELRSFRLAVAEAAMALAPGPAAAIAANGDARQTGDLLCTLLDQLRRDPGGDAVALRATVRKQLRGLVDREVDLLADAIEGPGGHG